MSEMVKFYEDYIVELVNTARSDGWDIMVKDAYNFVSDHYVWEDKEDKHNLIKTVINDVGLKFYKLNTIT